MYQVLIKNYINKLTLSDIKKFGQQNGQVVSDGDAMVIYDAIKNDYKTLLSENYMEVFERVKKQIDPNVYNATLNMFQKYKNLYNL